MAETLIAGRYRLDSLLGQTGMSEVWAATDLELGRRVALKLLAPDADSARFEREARAVASLAHPNVMQLYDYGREDGRPYMVLEYLPGGTLEDRLRPGAPLADEDAQRIAADVAAGLAHAHAREVVHRDLKPANVLFDEEGRAKIGDFGIARLAAGEGTLTEAGTVLGTATYISPEQAAGAPATAASDVYSFGVMLYRMVTGRLPFESSNPMELVALHRDAPVPPVSSFREDAPARLESTASAALAKDPRDRPRDGGALLAELGAPAGAGIATAVAPVADPDPTSAIPLSAAPRPPRRRHRAALAAVALLTLAIAGAAVAYELTRPASSSLPTGTLPPISFSAPAGTQPVSSAAPTAATAASTSAPGTTATRPTTRRVTLPPPPTTTVQPPATTIAPPPPATTAPAAATVAPPPTTTAATTAP